MKNKGLNARITILLTKEMFGALTRFAENKQSDPSKIIRHLIKTLIENENK